MRVCTVNMFNNAAYCRIPRSETRSVIRERQLAGKNDSFQDFTVIPTVFSLFLQGYWYIFIIENSLLTR